MSDVIIEVESSHESMAELRPQLDAALGQQFPGGMLKRWWEGDVLHLSGPGAVGRITLEGGKLIGRAELSPPASTMQAIIEEKIGKAMEIAVG